MRFFTFCAVLVLVIVACTPSSTPTSLSTPVPPTVTLVPIPTATTLPPTPTQTSTPQPTATATTTATPTSTATPTATPLPGTVVVALDKMAKEIPWLPLDKKAAPAVYYYGFNMTKPPFNNPLVRQAFAAATDRKRIVEIVASWGAQNARPATTFTPPETLGRDLFGQVGVAYDPAKARDLLAKAGYPNGQGFPMARFSVSKGTRYQLADALLNMWRENLKIAATWETLGNNFNEFVAFVNAGNSDIYWIGWVADVNDPDNFLKGVFYSPSQYNHTRFSNATFDRLVDQAASAKDPALRQSLYIQAERILCEEQTAIVPLYHYSYNYSP